MLFDKETRYWQEEYKKGNLDDEIMPGEIMCILDGTAEKQAFKVFKWCLLAIPTALVMAVLGHIEAGSPATYMKFCTYLQDHSLLLGLPIGWILVYPIILTTVLNITITRHYRNKKRV